MTHFLFKKVFFGVFKVISMIEALLSHFQPLIIATAHDGGGAICILMHNASMAPLPSRRVVMETLYACYTYVQFIVERFSGTS